jgi:hypothetical protein
VVNGEDPDSPDQLSGAHETCGTECMWLPLIQSPYPLWLATSCFLLALMLNGYVLAGERSANPWRRNFTREDQEAIVVSGNIRQQRDAVLTNFARYSNRSGESIKPGQYAHRGQSNDLSAQVRASRMPALPDDDGE